MAVRIQVTFDAADPPALAAFWGETLGYVEQDPPEGFDSWEAWAVANDLPRENWDNYASRVDPDGVGPRLYFQRVPEPKAAKNRCHLDVRAAEGLQGDDRMARLEAECERLTALGATRVRRFEPDGLMSSGFIVMADPEGNEFCLD